MPITKCPNHPFKMQEIEPKTDKTIIPAYCDECRTSVGVNPIQNTHDIAGFIIKFFAFIMFLFGFSLLTFGIWMHCKEYMVFWFGIWFLLWSNGIYKTTRRK